MPPPRSTKHDLSPTRSFTQLTYIGQTQVGSYKPTTVVPHVLRQVIDQGEVLVRVLGLGLGHTHVPRRPNRRAFAATSAIDLPFRLRRRRAPYAATGWPIVLDKGRPISTGAVVVIVVTSAPRAAYRRNRLHPRRCNKAVTPVLLGYVLEDTHGLGRVDEARQRHVGYRVLGDDPSRPPHRVQALRILAHRLLQAVVHQSPRNDGI